MAQGMVQGAGHAAGQAGTGHEAAHGPDRAAGHGGGHASVGAHGQHETQQHPLGIYFKIWGLLFVLSAASYAVDYDQFQGYLRWTLIVVFMLLKAGLIVSVFMHMVWERLALMYAILVPPLLLLVLLGIGALEADHTFLTRGTFFGAEPAVPAKHHP